MSTMLISNLRELRLNKGWSQDHLAAVTSLSKRTIQRIESGTPASLETANALVGALGLSSLHELVLPIEKPKEAIYETNAPSLLKKRSHVYFENKPMNNLGYLMAFLMAAMLSAISMLFSKFVLSDFIKNHEVQFFAVPTAVFLILFFYIINTYSEYRTAKDNRPESKEERLRTLVPGTTTQTVGPKSFLHTIRKYPVRKGEFPVGVNADTGNMVFTKYSTGTLMVGEEGSGILLSALGQLFPIFCEQRPGLIIIARESANYVLQIKSVLSKIGRKDDIVVLSELDAQILSKENIQQHTFERKILVCLRADQDDFVANKLLATWLETMSEPQPPTSYVAPFLFITDNDVHDEVQLRKALKKARAASSLWTLLVITEPERVLSLKAASLMSYFSQKHLLRQHNPRVAEQFINNLWTEGGAPVSASHLLELNAGVSVYVRDGLCWKNMRLTFLDVDMC